MASSLAPVLCDDHHINLILSHPMSAGARNAGTAGTATATITTAAAGTTAAASSSSNGKFFSYEYVWDG